MDNYTKVPCLQQYHRISVFLTVAVKTIISELGELGENFEIP